MIMTHPGLPYEWAIIICLLMIILIVLALRTSSIYEPRQYSINLVELPVIGPLIKFLTFNSWPLFILKLIVVLLFLFVITAGLFGSPIAERNLATVLTWNLWWTGVIVSVFFLGSAWCAICPWDTIAGWLIRRRLWYRTSSNNSLNLKLPKRLRNIYPALFLLVGLTWLELGFGFTINPYMTAFLGLLIMLLAIFSLAIYENKPFCRFFCPIGRTIGFYSQLAVVELRPIDTDICANCTTLECYYGTETIEPCPTRLVMGRLKQNTYCTSCGNCVQSCSKKNIAWRMRPPTREIAQDARSHWDEAWFMLILLGITSFHGVTMMPFFEKVLSKLGYMINDSGSLLLTFSILLFISLLISLLVYIFFIWLTKILSISPISFKKLFSGFAFTALPLAFVYHLAHNLNHLVRENDGIGQIILNPLGIEAEPLSMMEKHARHTEILLNQDLIFLLQSSLIVFGFWVSLKIIQNRGISLIKINGRYLLPMIMFSVLITGIHLWLLTQPMIMRM
jgi:polyferredoxin|tara:strand:+ start:417 stop:1937 length:1521 start_codon:yes stop_codon:yes gene_type:complete